MFRGMMKEIVDLLDVADEARLLATATTDSASVRGWLQYAAALEAEAAHLDKQWAEESGIEYADKPYRGPTAAQAGPVVDVATQHQILI